MIKSGKAVIFPSVIAAFRRRQFEYRNMQEYIGPQAPCARSVEFFDPPETLGLSYVNLGEARIYVPFVISP